MSKFIASGIALVAIAATTSLTVLPVRSHPTTDETTLQEHIDSHHHGRGPHRGGRGGDCPRW
ncbi:hypothetical protein [Baaleninema sp.]|uniref:hypothetical protein n=1 Tax=Baaleninema sp. TaxID=3101197 RepID=UPI003D05EF19